MSPSFVRGMPILKILYDSYIAPKCTIPVLSTHLCSCRAMFTESNKKKRNAFLDARDWELSMYSKRSFILHSEWIPNRLCVHTNKSLYLKWG